VLILVLETASIQSCYPPEAWEDSLYPGALSHLRSELNDCISTHISCRKHTRPQGFRRPNRLLNLNAGGPSRVTLEETQNHSHEESQDGCYTLSHCWGNSQPLKLTRASEQQLKEGVEIVILPDTFRHAIEVCRRMDIAYIWIDFMCIFQDDLANWETQAASMHDIYASALCNIAATSASDSSQGLRFQRDQILFETFAVFAPPIFGTQAGSQKRNYHLSCICFIPAVNTATMLTTALSIKDRGYFKNDFYQDV
jgi:hypothetical protein